MSLRNKYSQASHQYGLGSIPAQCYGCGLSLLLVLSLVPGISSCEVAQFAEFFEIHQAELHHQPSFSLTALAISFSCLRPLSINILS